MAELFASLPRHLYCFVERRFLGIKEGLEPCAWFGLTSMPGRAWGLSLLLECGAVYSHVPPHALYFPVPGADHSATPWPLRRAQQWDCFGTRFAVHEYEGLADLAVTTRVIEGEQESQSGRYLFTAQHYGDGYSRAPEQAKQYHFVRLDNGRLAALPATALLFHDPAFTDVAWPDWLRTQEAIYRCEA